MANGFKKITIIVEDDETIETTVIPMAHDISYDVTYEDTNSFDLLQATKFTRPAIEEITMSFNPIQDEDGIVFKIFKEDK